MLLVVNRKALVKHNMQGHKQSVSEAVVAVAVQGPTEVDVDVKNVTKDHDCSGEERVCPARKCLDAMAAAPLADTCLLEAILPARHMSKAFDAQALVIYADATQQDRR